MWKGAKEEVGEVKRMTCGVIGGCGRESGRE